MLTLPPSLWDLIRRFRLDVAVHAVRPLVRVWQLLGPVQECPVCPHLVQTSDVGGLGVRDSCELLLMLYLTAHLPVWFTRTLGHAATPVRAGA